MRDASGAFRTAVWAALDGNLTAVFDGSNSPVSVYDEQVTTDRDSLYVLLSSENSTDESNRTRFVRNVSLLLEITHKPDYSIDSRVLDDISDQILEVLLPTTQTDGLIAQSGWQFVALKVESGNKLNMAISSTSSIHRKLITLTCRVVQLN
jgi:hypothetical protein